MPKVAYSKTFLSCSAQIALLKSRGMQFADETKASHLLQNVSYYRFSGYWYPFLADKQTHIFKPDTNFETAFNLYKFDRELRQLIISELEKIEVAVRSKMAYVLSTACDAFWIDNANLFVDSAKHRVTLAKISEELSRSDEEFIMSFKSKYTNPFPPSFILLEITSFGALSRLYENLKSGKAKKDIANLFCLSDKVFASWLHSLVYVRNVCAHHARIWNKWLQVQPLFPKHTSNIWLIDKTVSNRRMYYVLSMIIYLLNTVNPKHTFRQKLAALFAKYPNVDKRAMGFPVDWENEPLWSAPIHLQQSV